MTINLQKPDVTELKPRITVFGVGGGGGNAVNNMIVGGLEGVEFVVANTDAQALTMSKAQRLVQMGVDVTEGLGAGSRPEVGRAAAEESLTEIIDHLDGTHMAFVTAGMGGGTGTGAAPVVARAAREKGILTVGVVTKPFHFEGQRRMKLAEAGIKELQDNVDTLIVIPNQNLFRIANDKTTFADAFGMADQVLYSGVACITDLMVREGLINLDFADVRSVMNEMGKAMMGTGEASGDGRAMQAAEAAISNPLLDETSMLGAQGLLISITGGRDMTLFEVDEAATRIREEVDADANIILGATYDEGLEGTIRVSVVATGIDNSAKVALTKPMENVITTGSMVVDRSVERVEQVARALELPQVVAPIAKDGVRIEPFRPQSTIFADSTAEEEFKVALEEELMPREPNFVPPAPAELNRPVAKSVIPDVQDFPPLVRAEIEAKTNPAATREDRGPLGLLKKIRSGLGGGEAAAPVVPASIRATSPIPGSASVPVQPIAVSAAPSIAAPIAQTAAQIVKQNIARAQPAPVSQSPLGNIVGAQTAPLQKPAASPYAPNHAGLDDNGRIATQTNALKDEDQLDIPAFLRRKAN